MKDNKFVVFKADDIYNFVEDCTSRTRSAFLSGVEIVDKAVESWALSDATVIRGQDVFAPPALDAYANSIIAAVQVLRGKKDGDLTLEEYGIVRRLEGIADYFHQQAAESWNMNRKIPD